MFMGPIWGRQDPDGPHVGPMNIAIWVLKGFGKTQRCFKDNIVDSLTNVSSKIILTLILVMITVGVDNGSTTD